MTDGRRATEHLFPVIVVALISKVRPAPAFCSVANANADFYVNVLHCLFQVSVDELKALLAKYNDTDTLAQTGLTVAATKYMYLSSSDKVVRAKKGTNGCHCIKTTQGPIERSVDNRKIRYRPVKLAIVYPSRIQLLT